MILQQPSLHTLQEHKHILAESHACFGVIPLQFPPRSGVLWPTQLTAPERVLAHRAER